VIEHGKDDDDVVVVAWLDRGVSLPGELWRVGRGARRLVTPAPRTAVTVWGLLGAETSSPLSSSSTASSKEP
jgi:hypothetical protein